MPESANRYDQAKAIASHGDSGIEVFGEIDRVLELAAKSSDMTIEERIEMKKVAKEMDILTRIAEGILLMARQLRNSEKGHM